MSELLVESCKGLPPARMISVVVVLFELFAAEFSRREPKLSQRRAIRDYIDHARKVALDAGRGVESTETFQEWGSLLGISESMADLARRRDLRLDPNCLIGMSHSVRACSAYLLWKLEPMAPDAPAQHQRFVDDVVYALELALSTDGVLDEAKHAELLRLVTS
jgi:hypothetical protein